MKNRKVKLPAEMVKKIAEQKKKFAAVIAESVQFKKEFGSLEKDAEKFEAEIAKMELACDPNDEAGLDAIARVERQARLARNKYKQSGEVERKIAAELENLFEEAESVIISALYAESEQLAEEITNKLLPYVHDTHTAKNVARIHVPIVGAIRRFSEIGFSFKANIHDPTKFATKILDALETLLKGESPAPFQSALDAQSEE
jgi:hypothetical protein